MRDGAGGIACSNIGIACEPSEVSCAERRKAEEKEN